MISAKKVFKNLINDIDKAKDGDINDDNNHQIEYLYSDQSGDVLVCYKFLDYYHYRLSMWQTREEIDAGGPEIWTYIFPVNYGPNPDVVNNWHHAFNMK